MGPDSNRHYNFCRHMEDIIFRPPCPTTRQVCSTMLHILKRTSQTVNVSNGLYHVLGLISCLDLGSHCEIAISHIRPSYECRVATESTSLRVAPTRRHLFDLQLMRLVALRSGNLLWAVLSTDYSSLTSSSSLSCLQGASLFHSQSILQGSRGSRRSGSLITSRYELPSS